MIIYRDCVSSDELFTDAFKIKELPNGIFLEVEGKLVTRAEGDLDNRLFGGNASAEEPEESPEASQSSGIDIVLNHSLVLVEYPKKKYIVYLKEYMKAVKTRLMETNPGRVDEFMKCADTEVKKVLADFASYDLYSGPSLNPNGMLGLLNYREDGVTPYFLFFKDGLIIEKC